jgi:predicted metal-dependent hydrolase
MKSRMSVEGIDVEVSRKQMKHLRLRLDGPEGDVKLSAPHGVPRRELEAFVVAKLEWIRAHRSRLAEVPLVTPASFVSGELHLLWGEDHRLVVREARRAHVGLVDGRLEMRIGVGADVAARERVLERFYRRQLGSAIPLLVDKWEPMIVVEVAEWRVRKMKTRWGTCNIGARRIWLNLELAKRRAEFLEYVVVHEMVHLRERLHGERFQALMTEVLPDWRVLRAELNSVVGIGRLAG